ncbi:MAG: PLD nuclease N-terminal domain-containing protein [Lacisediminihabitans sp.]
MGVQVPPRAPKIPGFPSYQGNPGISFKPAQLSSRVLAGAFNERAATVTADGGLSVAAVTQAVWMWSTAAAFALFLVAIFSVVGFRHRMRVSRFVLWTALVLLVPVIGPVVWFVAGRRRYPPKVEESFTVPPGTPRLH